MFVDFGLHQVTAVVPAAVPEGIATTKNMYLYKLRVSSSGLKTGGTD
ncbi:MAG: hypothetical protein ACE5JO_01085 [Candidatus Binatia bacterium]